MEKCTDCSSVLSVGALPCSELGLIGVLGDLAYLGQLIILIFSVLL